MRNKPVEFSVGQVQTNYFQETELKYTEFPFLNNQAPTQSKAGIKLFNSSAPGKHGQ